MSSVSQKLNRIIFAAGGTGGHIYPAIAVADELKKMNENINICFIGAKGKMEEKVIPGQGYLLKTINVRGFSRSLNPKNIMNALKLYSSVRQAGKILKEFAPDIIFGTGGYVSGPVLWSANKLKIPSILYEGNLYPGLTVRLLAAKVNKILVNFPESKKFFKKQDKVEIMPYPVRTNLKKYSRVEALNSFGLNPGKKTLFVFGGSQGAASINSALLKNLKRLIASGTQLIWQTGGKDFNKIKDAVEPDESVKLFKFIDRVDYAYSAADLVVCRSGISALMEIAYFGVPAIFVPYPYSTDDHQLKNAQRLHEQNAAEMVLDKDIEIQLAAKIIDLIKDVSKLTQMRTNIKQFSDINAASKIAGYLNNFVASLKN